MGAPGREFTLLRAWFRRTSYTDISIWGLTLTSVNHTLGLDLEATPLQYCMSAGPPVHICGVACPRLAVAGHLPLGCFLFFFFFFFLESVLFCRMYLEDKISAR